MADITLIADVSSIKEADKALKQFADSSAKLGRSVLDMGRKVEGIASAWDKANKMSEKGTINAKALKEAQKQLAREYATLNGYLKSNGALNTQRALAELKAAQATRDAAAAQARANAENQKAKQSYHQLKMSIDSAYASQERMRQGVQAIRNAQRAKVISTQEAIAALRQLRVAQDSVAEGSQFASRGLNRTGVVAQQAGYQIGDFFVQIQSGTNAMVAFGQQMTQLVGTFAMFAKTTRAAMIASGVGIFVSIGTAIGAAIMRMNGQMDTLDTKIQKVETSFNELNESLSRFHDDDLDQTFGNMAGDVRDMASAMVELNNAAALNNLTATFEKLEEASSAGLMRHTGEGALNILRVLGLRQHDVGEGLFGYKSTEEVNEEAFEKLGFNMARTQFDSYIGRLQELASSGDIEGVTSLVADFFQDATDGQKQVSMQGIDLVRSLETAALVAAEFAAEQNGSAEAARQTTQAQKDLEDLVRSSAEAYREVAEEQDKLNERNAASAASLEEQNSFMKKRLEIMQMELAGEASSEVILAAKKALELEILEAKLLSQVAADGITEAEREAVEQAIRLAGEMIDVQNAADAAANNISDGADEAARLDANLRQAASAISAIAGATLSANIRAVGLRARTEALRAGQDLVGANVAGSVAEERARLAPALGSADAPIRAAAQAELNDFIEASNLAADAQRALNAELEKTRGGSGRDGGGGAQGYGGIFPELQAQVEAAMEKTKAYEEEIKLLDFALDKGMITQEKYNQAVAQAQEFYGQAADAATNYEDILLKMANTTSDALGDAMMSIVDGTKSASDAFSDMTQIILKKAFELLVINPILNSIFGGVSGFNPLPSLVPGAIQANGGVWNNGSQVTAFANGGVVGSPTFFPMANGGVGLMGEAGPEAIMPLKRGKGGRLGVEVSGEQGNVTIHQTFAFSANGDDSVKKIIAQEAPKIAALTQKQMLDARRRGGVVRDTFA